MGGVLIDPEQAFVGVFWETPEIGNRFHLRPGIDGGFGGDVNVATINFDFIAKFSLGSSGWKFIQGGGPAIVIAKFDTFERLSAARTSAPAALTLSASRTSTALSASSASAGGNVPSPEAHRRLQYWVLAGPGFARAGPAFGVFRALRASLPRPPRSPCPHPRSPRPPRFRVTLCETFAFRVLRGPAVLPPFSADLSRTLRVSRFPRFPLLSAPPFRVLSRTFRSPRPPRTLAPSADSADPTAASASLRSTAQRDIWMPT